MADDLNIFRVNAAINEIWNFVFPKEAAEYDAGMAKSQGEPEGEGEVGTGGRGPHKKVCSIALELLFNKAVQPRLVAHHDHSALNWHFSPEMQKLINNKTVSF